MERNKEEYVETEDINIEEMEKRKDGKNFKNGQISSKQKTEKKGERKKVEIAEKTKRDKRK